jgi:hypothetical protein
MVHTVPRSLSKWDNAEQISSSSPKEETVRLVERVIGNTTTVLRSLTMTRRNTWTSVSCSPPVTTKKIMCYYAVHIKRHNSWSCEPIAFKRCRNCGWHTALRDSFTVELETSFITISEGWTTLISELLCNWQPDSPSWTLALLLLLSRF